MWREKMLVLTMRKDNANEPPQSERLIVCLCRDGVHTVSIIDYIFGPAATKALPASFVVNFSKFLMKREERSLAFSSQTFLSA